MVLIAHFAREGLRGWHMPRKGLVRSRACARAYGGIRWVNLPESAIGEERHPPHRPLARRPARQAAMLKLGTNAFRSLGPKMLALLRRQAPAGPRERKR